MKKILIVDDDTFVTSVYCNKFRSEGFDAEITCERHDGPPDDQEGIRGTWLCWTCSCRT